MAEVLMRRHLTLAGVDATVSSAGVYEGGAPATAHGVATMADRGLDLEGHQSRRLDAAMVRQADLIIGMAREHVREAAVLDRDVLPRTFTLKELAREAKEVGPRPAGMPLDSWLRRIAAAREPGSLVGVGYHDDYDVEDPVGRGRPDYEKTADLIDSLLERVVALAFPDADHDQERSR
jgi:protein-tyrosine phosphatase